MGEQLKNDILDLLKKMNKNQLLGADLYQEIYYWLSKKTDNEFEENHAKVTRGYEILQKYNEHGLEKLTNNELNSEKLTKRSMMLLESLNSYRDHMDHYSVLSILIKVELLLFNTLAENSVSDERTTQNGTLTDIYSTKSNGQQFQQPTTLTKDHAEACDNDGDERLYLLNELMDAPLDDIIEFMRNNGWSFEEIFTYEFYDDMLYRLENPPPNSNYSSDITNKLCKFIKKKVTKKYDLTRMEFVSLLADQFYIITPNKYRIYLEKFVENNRDDNFTLENFYSFHRIPSALSPEENQKFASLFKIYCQKLLGESKSQQLCQSTKISNNSNCREEGTNLNPWYDQCRVRKSISYQIQPLQYNLKSNTKPPQNINESKQQGYTSHKPSQHNRKTYFTNKNRMNYGQQMSLPCGNNYRQELHQHRKPIK